MIAIRASGQRQSAPAGLQPLSALDRSVLDTVPCALCVFDRQGEVAWFNRRAAILFGRPPGSAAGAPASAAPRIHSLLGVELDFSDTPMARAIASGAAQPGEEFILVCPDGRRVRVGIEAAPLPGASGSAEACMASLREIAVNGEAQPIAGIPHQHRHLLDTLPAALYTTDADGVITYFNRAAAELAGREPEIGVDKWCVTWRLYRGDGTPLPHDECPMAISLRERRAVRGAEAIAERPDGTRVPFLPYPTPIFDAEGRLTGAVNMLIDVSERKLHEEALRSQSNRLNRVARAVSSDLDLERIVQAVTDAATELTGAKFGAFFYNVTGENGECLQLYTLSGAPREAFEKFGLPRNTAVFEPTFRGLGIVRSDDIRKDSRYGLTGPHFGMPPGHLEVASYLAVPVVSRTGEVTGGLFFGHDRPGVFTEATEELVTGIAAHAAIAIDNARLLQAAKDELERRSRAEQAAMQLASIVESSNDAIVSKTLDGIISSWNRGAERLFGYSAEEVVGRPVTILIPEDQPDEEPRILERLRRGERIESYETVRRRKDRRLIDVSLTVSPVRDPQGRIVGASKIARDITARKQAERQLARRVEEQTALYRFTNRLYRAGSLADICDAAFEAIERALGCARASILLFDNDEIMRFVAWKGLSETYRQAVDGHCPWPADASDPQPLLVGDVANADIPDALRTVVRAEGIGALAFIPLMAKGRLIGKFMTYYTDAREFAAEEVDLALAIARQLGFSIDRLRTHAELRRNEERERARAAELQAIMEAVPAIIWIARDTDCRVISGNRTSFEFLRLDPLANPSLTADTAERPNHFEVYVDGRRLQPSELPVQRAARGEEVGNFEEEVRFNDGSSRFLFGNATPLRDADGAVTGAVAAFVDITDRKKAEEQRDLLVAELNHRVKNTLATVIAIAHQSFARCESVEAARHSFDNRVRALAQTHGRLAESNWSGISLQTLLHDETAPYAGDGAHIRFAGPTVTLNPRLAVSLGMAFHELTTNAAKYGALSGGGGAVDVTWRIDPAERQLVIHWSEAGGPPVAPPTRTGFGRLLLERALSSDLQGKVALDFRPAGLECVIAFPFAGGAGAAART